MFKLRELEREDLKQINEWRNDPELVNLLVAPFRFMNHDVDERWFDNYMANRDTEVRCSILDENETLLGMVSLLSVDHVNQCAEIRTRIGNKKNQDRGAGAFANYAMLIHAFQNMNLHRIEAYILESNIRSQRVSERIGFKKEGIMRKALYKNGEFVNIFMYSLLKEEFDIVRAAKMVRALSSNL